jgi:hypothetical protein
LLPIELTLRTPHAVASKLPDNQQLSGSFFLSNVFFLACLLSGITSHRK